MDALNPLPRATVLLDFDWTSLPAHERISAVCNFVGDAIAFGYDRRDDLPVLALVADR